MVPEPHSAAMLDYLLTVVQLSTAPETPKTNMEAENAEFPSHLHCCLGMYTAPQYPSLSLPASQAWMNVMLPSCNT